MIARHLIDGRWSPSGGRPSLAVINPADDTEVGRVLLGDAADVDLAVAAASRALPAWRSTPMTERIAIVERVSDGIAAQRERLARTLTREMGSPIAFARAAQVGVALADIAELIAAARAHVDRSAVSRSLVVSEPAGVVAAITPWNFPLHQIVLKVVAAMLAGCTVVLKPSEVAPLNAVILGEIFSEAGVPDGVINIVFGDGPGVGAPLAAHPDVDLVTFTGSRDVGARIAEAAAATITKVALELGGKSAAIMLDDAPIADAAAGVVRSCFANTGQTCAALTRVLVPRAQQAEWERALVEAGRSWIPGDPEDENTVLGPLASSLQRDRVCAHLAHAVADGAVPLLGLAGDPADSAVPAVPAVGAWQEPVILGGVTPEMRVFRDEVFGPVLTVSVYDTDAEAIELANDSDYGLSGGVWSADTDRAIAVALQVRTGTIGINGEGLDVGAPFGGVKQSGIGRECGVLGFEEFLETKSVMGASGTL